MPRPADAATTVRLTSPNGGENWRTGETRNITWTCTDAADYDQAVLQYSTDSGATWDYMFPMPVNNSGSHSWTVPLSIETTHDARIKIRIQKTGESESPYSDTSDADFTIQQTIPLSPGNLHEDGVISTAVKLKWIDTSNNEEGFKIERKTGSGGFTQVGTVDENVTTYWDSGLTPGTTYSYRVRAYNHYGNSGYSNETSATTISFSIAVPQAPSDLSASVLSGNEIGLAWTDNSGGETGFKIERKTGAGEFTQIATVGANVKTYYDDEVEAGAYRYRVRAYNASGDSEYSNEANAVVLAILIPTFDFLQGPTDLEAAASEDEAGISLSWRDNSSGETGFKVERRTGSGSFDEIAEVDEDITSYTDTGLDEETTYYYRVCAYNVAGNSIYSNEAHATTPALEAPPTGAEGTTVLRFYIDSSEYYVKGPSDSTGVLHTMDTVPVIRESRTLLPIRYVAEPLGASVDWLQSEQKVTVRLGEKTINLWIGSGTASINGTSVAIDPANPAVAPVILPPGRTMLPLRFIAENLGCQVEWNPGLREITVTYPKP